MFPLQSSLDLTDSVSCLSSCKEEHCVSIHFKLLLCIISGVLGSLHKAEMELHMYKTRIMFGIKLLHIEPLNVVVVFFKLSCIKYN